MPATRPTTSSLRAAEAHLAEVRAVQEAVDACCAVDPECFNAHEREHLASEAQAAQDRVQRLREAGGAAAGDEEEEAERVRARIQRREEVLDRRSDALFHIFRDEHERLTRRADELEER